MNERESVALPGRPIHRQRGFSKLKAYNFNNNSQFEKKQQFIQKKMDDFELVFIAFVGAGLGINIRPLAFIQKSLRVRGKGEGEKGKESLPLPFVLLLQEVYCEYTDN